MALKRKPIKKLKTNSLRKRRLSNNKKKILWRHRAFMATLNEQQA